MQCEYVNPREWNHGPGYTVKGCSHRAIYWVIFLFAAPAEYEPEGGVNQSPTRLNVCTRHKNRFVHNQDAFSVFRYGLLKDEPTFHPISVEETVDA